MEIYLEKERLIKAVIFLRKLSTIKKGLYQELKYLKKKIPIILNMNISMKRVKLLEYMDISMERIITMLNKTVFLIFIMLKDMNKLY